MKPPKSNVKRELPEEGTHSIRCTEVIDFGTQPGSVQFPDPKRKCQVGFQLVDEQTSSGKAMMVYKQYTFSASNKGNLMKDCTAWLGAKAMADFDMDALLNKDGIATIGITETAGGEFANVTNISAVPKGVKVRKATEPIRSLYLDKDEFDQDIFDALPEWMRNKIAASPEYAEIIAAKSKPAKKSGAKVAAKKKK